MILYTPKFNLSIFLIIPICFLISCLYTYRHNRKKNSLVCCIIWGFISIFFISINTIYSIVPIFDFYNGNYQVIEGYVDDFKPRPPGGHSQESFSINGVEFEYSDGIIKPGYRKSYYKGGVIKGNGQYLRIGYTDYGDGNAIVLIENPPFSENPSEQVSPFAAFILPIFIVAIVALFTIFYIIYKRDRIKIDTSKSFISNISSDNGKVIIQCKIVFSNTFKCAKSIRIWGYFKKEKQSRIITDCKLEGKLKDNLCDYIEIMPGINKYVINFIGNADIGKNNTNSIFSVPVFKLKIEK